MSNKTKLLFAYFPCVFAVNCKFRLNWFFIFFHLVFIIEFAKYNYDLWFLIYDFENSVIKCQSKQNCVFFAVNCKFRLNWFFIFFYLVFIIEFAKYNYDLWFLIYDFENSVIKCQPKQNCVFFAVNCKFRLNWFFIFFYLVFIIEYANWTKN